MEVGGEEDYPRTPCEDIFRFHSPSSDARSAALGRPLVFFTAHFASLACRISAILSSITLKIFCRREYE